MRSGAETSACVLLLGMVLKECCGVRGVGVIMITKAPRALDNTLPGNFTRYTGTRIYPGTVPGYPGETSLSLSATQKKKSYRYTVRYSTL